MVECLGVLIVGPVDRTVEMEEDRSMEMEIEENTSMDRSINTSMDRSMISSTDQSPNSSTDQHTSSSAILASKIHSALSTFVRAFLCASNDQNILLYHNHKGELCEHQYNHNKGIQTIPLIPSEISSIPLTNRFAQMILHMSKVARLNGTYMKKRILFVQVGNQGIDSALGALSPKLISLAYHCKNSEIVCDSVAVEQVGNACGVLKQVAEIGGGVQVQVQAQVKSGDGEAPEGEKIVLGVLFGFLGLDSGSARRLMPVKSEAGDGALIDAAACNCHGKAISIGY